MGSPLSWCLSFMGYSVSLKVKVAQSCPTLCNLVDSYSPWNSLLQNTGVGTHSLLQGIFPTQGLNPGLPHCRQILYQVSHQGSPRILECIDYPFSSGSSNPGIEPGVSCIAGRFFNNWAIREASMSLGPCNSWLYDSGQVSPPPLTSVSWSVKHSCRKVYVK